MSRTCVCPQTTRRDCIEIRYGKNEYGEECECPCHDEQDIEDEEFYYQNLRDEPKVYLEDVLVPDEFPGDDECDFTNEDVIT